MELDNLLDKCSNLETIVLGLIQANLQLSESFDHTQKQAIELYRTHLKEVSDRETKLQQQIEQLKSECFQKESEIKAFSYVNGQLSDLVNSAQKTKCDPICDTSYLNISDSIQEYEKLKADHKELANRIQTLQGDAQHDKTQLVALVGQARELARKLQRNDNAIRVLDQQNRCAEQQFDLILNQVPWEPLSEAQVNKLRSSDDKKVREITEILQMQATEIADLNESLAFKKERKLRLLGKLSQEIHEFLRKRAEAVT